MDTTQPQSFFSLYKLFWWWVYSAILVGSLTTGIVILSHLNGVQILFVEQGNDYRG
jgi:hypothetical protein